MTRTTSTQIKAIDRDEGPVYKFMDRSVATLIALFGALAFGVALACMILLPFSLVFAALSSK